MKTLVKTAGLSRAEWLKWRTKGIGGSDVSVIAGLNKYKSAYQLWLEKTGQQMPQEDEGNDYIHFGNVFEPVIKQEFTRRTGIKVRAKRCLLQSDEYPFMIADLDGVINEGGEMCIFEAKTASAYKKEQWEGAVPQEYMLQVQHYMAVTGAKKAYIAALMGGNYFCFHEICRDEGLIKQIIELEFCFWNNNVLGMTEPPADGSPATTAFLNGQYGESSKGTIELPQEALGLCRSYDEVTERLNVLKEQKEALANQLKNYLKENETGTVGDRTVSWKSVTTTAFDKKRLALENKEIYDAYTTQSTYRRFSVA